MDENEEFYKSVGRRVRAAREEAGLTLEECATAIGLNSGAVLLRYEFGERRLPLDVIPKLAQRLGKEVAYFIPVEQPSKIDFTIYTIGDPEAWSQLEREGFLKSYFVPVRQFSEIIDLDKTFLCGRRGSGKSAIAIKLADETQWRYRETVQGEVSQYGAYIEVVQRLSEALPSYNYVHIKRAVQRLWEWVLPVKAMQTVVLQTRQSGETIDADVVEMERYLDSLPPPLHSQSTIGQLLAETFARALQELPTGKFDTYLINLKGTKEFVRALAALERKTQTSKMLLVLDTLESYHIFAPFMIEGFQGILEAINAFRADRRMRGVSLKFFLPAEIYGQVSATIPAKVGGGTVFMRWRTADLISVLAGRFLAVLHKTKFVSDKQLRTLSTLLERVYSRHDGRPLREEFWYETRFLPRSVTSGPKREEDCLAYMLRHTFRRPRDIIMQMQAIVNNAVLAGEFPYISAKSVIDGVHNEAVLMSILGDALSPFEGRIPGDVIRGARTTFYGRPWIMSGRELKRFAEDLHTLYPGPDLSPEEFSYLLLRAGVVGLALGRPSVLYRKAWFEYLMPDNLPRRDDLEYCVHPVVGDLFHMKAPEDGKAIYPLSEHDTWLEDTANI